MVERATDERLGRETRRSLACNIVCDSLHALREGREPAIGPERVQQMIRSLDDDVRTHCAKTLTQFLREVSKPNKSPDAPSQEDLFLSVAKPFLLHIWPQERPLTSLSLSSALAELPAATGGRFVEAVEVVDRFLIPFDCWSMLDYGLFGDDAEGTPRLSMIDSEDRAKALLRLLDHTVGTTESAVVPHNLGDALSRVRTVAPNVTSTREYRRLESAARRA